MEAKLQFKQNLKLLSNMNRVLNDNNRVQQQNGKHGWNYDRMNLTHILLSFLFKLYNPISYIHFITLYSHFIVAYYNKTLFPLEMYFVFECLK